MAQPKDDDIVVFFEGKYFLVKREAWSAEQLQGGNAGPAKVLIEAGATVGYIPPAPVAPGIGGYSTVLNLHAVLKGHGGFESLRALDASAEPGSDSAPAPTPAHNEKASAHRRKR